MENTLTFFKDLDGWFMELFRKLDFRTNKSILNCYKEFENNLRKNCLRKQIRYFFSYHVWYYVVKPIETKHVYGKILF